MSPEKEGRRTWEQYYNNAMVQSSCPRCSGLIPRGTIRGENEKSKCLKWYKFKSYTVFKDEYLPWFIISSASCRLQLSFGWRSRQNNQKLTTLSPTSMACATLLQLLHSFPSFHYIFHRGAQSLYSCPVTVTQWARVAFVASQPVGWWMSGRVSLTRNFYRIPFAGLKIVSHALVSRSCIETLTRNPSDWVGECGG